MTKRSISIELEIEELKLLEKRARQNFLSPRELASDIIRRSMLSYKGGIRHIPKLDDSLVEIFSRERRGGKRRK